MEPIFAELQRIHRNTEAIIEVADSEDILDYCQLMLASEKRLSDLLCQQMTQATQCSDLEHLAGHSDSETMTNEEEEKVEVQTELSGASKTPTGGNADTVDEPVSGSPAHKKVKKENFDAHAVFPS